MAVRVPPRAGPSSRTIRAWSALPVGSARILLNKSFQVSADVEVPKGKSSESSGPWGAATAASRSTSKDGKGRSLPATSSADRFAGRLEASPAAGKVRLRGEFSYDGGGMGKRRDARALRERREVGERPPRSNARHHARARGGSSTSVKTADPSWITRPTRARSASTAASRSVTVEIKARQATGNGRRQRLNAPLFTKVLLRPRIWPRFRRLALRDLDVLKVRRRSRSTAGCPKSRPSPRSRDGPS